MAADDEEDGPSGAPPTAPAGAGAATYDDGRGPVRMYGQRPTGNPDANLPAGAVGAPETLPAPSLDNMVVSPRQLEATRQRLLAIQQAKTANDAEQASQMTAQIDKDRARLNAKYDAIGTDLPQAWDANKKSAEHYTDPVTAFGSVGSVFAMLASSFAGLPMEASLNAGAAAINAIHQGDEKAYQREFDTWKANTDLAIKRHDIERQSYNDALTLMNSNINAGRTKMELAATQFGDEKVQALLENGMDKELDDLFISRNKAAIELAITRDKWEKEHEQTLALKNDPDWQSNDVDRKLAAVQRNQQLYAPNGAATVKLNTVQQLQRSWDKEHPGASYADRAAAFIDIEKQVADAQNAGMAGSKASTDLTEDRQRAAYIAKVRDDKVAEGMPYEQAVQEARTAADKAYPPKMTSTQAGRYQDRVFIADQTLQTVDKQLERLEHYVGIAGAPGYVTRAGEKIGNILGKTDVERQEFAKDIDLLRLNAARMLTLSQGRPLAAEASRINNIIKGINLGDTAAATAAALRDYQKFVTDFKNDASGRLGGVGGANPESIGATGSAPKSTGTPRWQQAPIVKPAAGPRAEAESEEAYG
jgi:hypothetical protein